MSVQSGVPKQEGGVWIGATDFSEFAVAAGVPAGITEYPPTTTGPSGQAIKNDVTEGNYFAFTPGAFEALRYELDAFTGLSPAPGNDMEMLARIWIPTHNTNRRIVGAGFNLGGSNQTDIDGALGGVYMRNASDYETTLLDADGGGVGSAMAADWQEVEATSVWVWQRFLVQQQNGNTRWRGKTWTGDLADEPAGWDGDSGAGGAKSVLDNNAIGWGVVALVRNGVEHRIAFLSFSEDPDTTATPGPDDIVAGGAPAAEYQAQVQWST